MNHERNLSYKYFDELQKFKDLRATYYPKPPSHALSLYDDWMTQDPFEMPNFTLHKKAPFTLKEVLNFELIKADHIKELVEAALPWEALEDAVGRD